MVQKPIATSVIAAITVAGILMLAIVATISSTNQAFAQAKPTILSLGSSPTSGHVGAHTGTLFGKLTSDHSPVDGASIIITGRQAKVNNFLPQLINSVTIALLST